MFFSYFTGAVPHGGHDGAQLRADRGDLAVLLRLPERQAAVGEDRHDLPAVLGAAVLPVPLRLRHESRQGRAGGGWEPQAQVPRRERGHTGQWYAGIPHPFIHPSVHPSSPTFIQLFIYLFIHLIRSPSICDYFGQCLNHDYSNDNF